VSEATEKMRGEGLPEIAIDTFARYEERLRAGEQGLVPESDIEPLDQVPSLAELDEGDPTAIERVVVLKLNGGLGTSMGMSKAKSLLEVKDGHTFLDVIARQILQLRERHGARIPLLLMNSFATRDDTLTALERYPELKVDELPLDFLQGRVPKLLADGGGPAEWPADPSLEWAPPGHGDVFASLAATGLLSDLLEGGYEYLFLSNSDNLGATLEPRVLGWLASERLPFVSEVVDRTESDRKGGHLARRRGDGGLLLREVAQVPDDDQPAFEDIAVHSYFNANNIWVSLRALDEALRAGGGVLELPMIVNRKTVDPKDSTSPDVVQLETAMGAAIGAFEGAGAVHVPRDRFVPVKKTSDLLVVRSDAYVLEDDWSARLVREREGRPPLVELDSDYFKLVADFEERFAGGPPSLAGCTRLEVDGDVSFGRDVVVRGSVRVEGPRRIEDGTLLEG
jgi:UTP--glucose-1-phosphate uridylyltransferase